MISQKVGFVGAGRMGSALMDGFLSAQIISKKNLIAYDLDSEKQAAVGKRGIPTANNSKDLVVKSDIIFIAVKPKDVPQLLDNIGSVSKGKLFVSIAAGVTTKKLEEKLKGRVVRVMPNIPCLVYHGASAFSPGSTATQEDGKRVQQFLNALGIAVRVDEELLDAVTGLSGSGPAYIYYIIKALADAGAEEGLPADVALKLAAQTAKGAAEMVLSTGKTPAQLIADVCSPGGTTIEGIKALEAQKVADALKQAVKAAAKRSRELSSR